jgi:hypothetical protein
MAAPVARGSRARLTPRAAWKTQPSVSSTTRAVMETANAVAASAAPRASQRSCSRSSPRARRNRSSNDTAPTTSPARTSRAPTGKMAAPTPCSRAATPSGFLISGYSGDSGRGCSTEARKATTTPAAVTLAHQRQRGDGRVPVGESRRMKPVQDR